MALGLQLSPHLAGLLDRYEEISIDLILHDNAKNLIEAGLDLDVRIGPIADSSLITRRLGSATAYLVAAPAIFATAPCRSIHVIYLAMTA
jgi:DNA-binding transcriptional LysR family regulator